MVLSIMMAELASKNMPNSRLESKKTLFETKTDKNHPLCGCTYQCSPYKTVSHQPGGAQEIVSRAKCVKFDSRNYTNAIMFVSL